MNFHRHFGLPPRSASAQRGLTLIEMMVSLVIGLILSLAIFGVLAAAEGRKRTTTSLNDSNQAGAYAIYALDKLVRSAGSGFVQSASYSLGCSLNAAKGGKQVLPVPAGGLPAPFAAVNTTGTAGVFRLAPVLIAPGQTNPTASGKPSDVLVVMAGASGGPEYPIDFADYPGEATLNLESTVGFVPDGLLLLADRQNDPTGVHDCLVGQVASSFKGGGTELALDGPYHANKVATASLAAFTSNGVAMGIGGMASNAPAFMLVGVGDANTLHSYDLLQLTDAPLASMADGVFELHALYGIDEDGDGKVDAWKAPSASPYTLAELGAGTSAANESLRKIKAIRVGLILRTSLQERDMVAPASISLFTDTPDLAHVRTLTNAERHFRYRAVESVIPLRNSLLI